MTEPHPSDENGRGYLYSDDDDVDSEESIIEEISTKKYEQREI